MSRGFVYKIYKLLPVSYAIAKQGKSNVAYLSQVRSP
jgi:hypothetical protein